MDRTRLIDIFKDFLGNDQILTGAADLEFYGKDSCKDFGAKPALILLPHNYDQVSSILKHCNQHNLKVVPSGGRTGYSGGATASNGEIVLSLTKLNKILDLNLTKRTLTCQAGVTTQAIVDHAASFNLLYPVEFSSMGSSQIGGNIATNAGGIRVVRYGSTRRQVLGLKVALASGEILSLNGALIKDATGYDLRSLFIGSEGTLGVIVEATLGLVSPARHQSVVLLALNSPEQALTLLQNVRTDFTLRVFEYFERDALELVLNNRKKKDPFSIQHLAYVLLEIEHGTPTEQSGLEQFIAELLESNTINDAVFAQSTQQQKELFAYRESISESIAQVAIPHKNDISFAISDVPRAINELKELFAKEVPEFKVIIFGHLGDGNIHINLLKPDALSPSDFFTKCAALDLLTFEICKNLGGSISAEHGVGLLKAPFVHFSRTPTELSLMRAIKRELDPNNILNPGKLLAVDAPQS